MSDTKSGMDTLPPGGVERRRHPRFSFSAPVLVRLLVEEETFTPLRFPGRSYNLSLGGVRVEINGIGEDRYRVLIQRSRPVRVHFSIPEAGGEVVFFGKTVSCDYQDTSRGGTCWIGIAFDELAEHEQQALRILLQRLRAKILVVSQDHDTCLMLETTFKAEGHETLFASDGLEALGTLRAEMPDVVFCDWSMQNLGGPELCRHARADYQLRLTYIILMAAKEEKKSRTDALAADADEFLTRPVDPNELRTRLRVAFGVVEYHKSLRGIALVDALTGVANRRAFEAALRRETARSRRFATPLSLVMVDVDDLKEINDRYGHSRGDAVLRLVAQRVAATCQREEVFRIGGDEFAVLLAQPDEVASSVAAKIRDAFGEKGKKQLADPAHPSISLGLANFEGTENPENLFHRADADMYKNKRARLARRAGAAGESDNTKAEPSGLIT